MTASAAASRGRHRVTYVVLPHPPSNDEKSSYAWRSLPFLAAALCVSAVCLITAQAWMEIRETIMVGFAGYTVLYFALSLIHI